RLGDAIRAQDAVAVLERGPRRKVSADELRVDGTVDHHMGDVDPERSEFARHTLRQGTQRVLAAGEGGEAAAPADAGRGAREQDGAAAARYHRLGHFAAHEETANAHISHTLK